MIVRGQEVLAKVDIHKLLDLFIDEYRLSIEEIYTLATMLVETTGSMLEQKGAKIIDVTKLGGLQGLVNQLDDVLGQPEHNPTADECAKCPMKEICPNRRMV